MSNTTDSRLKVCAVEDCEKAHYGRGYCTTHYQRWKRYGDPLGAYQPNSSRICSVDDCDRAVKHREWCGKHYQRWMNHGDPTANHSRRHVDAPCSVEGCEKIAIGTGLCGGHYTRSRAGRSVSEKPLRRYIVTDDLRERLHAYAPPGRPDECWTWTGGLNKGYGSIAVAGSKVRVAHVVAWEIEHQRRLPKGMVIRHSCDNPPCVNPSHLLLGTHGDNNADKAERHRCGYNGSGFRHLVPDEVRDIRRKHSTGVNMTELARQYGRSRATIIRVVSRQSFADID